MVLLLLDLVFVVFSLTATAIVLVLVQLCPNSLDTLILPLPTHMHPTVVVVYPALLFQNLPQQFTGDHLDLRNGDEKREVGNIERTE